MAKTASDHLIERPAEWGIKRIFGYPGDGIIGQSAKQMLQSLLAKVR